MQQLAACVELADRSPRVGQLRALQAMADRAMLQPRTRPTPGHAIDGATAGSGPRPAQLFVINTPVIDPPTLRQNAGEALQSGETIAGGGARLNTPGNVTTLYPVVDEPLNGAPTTVPTSVRKQQWVQRVLNRLETGATELTGDVAHWGNRFANRPGIRNCSVLAIELTGADLHERGLGVARLDLRFERRLDVNERMGDVMPRPDWQTESRSLILKPDDRSFEQLLLGSGGGSIAGQLNVAADLGDNSIETIAMHATANHGTVVGFVEDNLGTYLKSWQRWLTRDDQPVVEAVAFALLAGLWDLHDHNVIMKGGKPVLIDAEVGMVPNIFANQHQPGQHLIRNAGFSNKAQGTVDTQVGGARGASRLLEWARQNPAQLGLIMVNTIGNARSRVVPVFTSGWAHLKNEYLGAKLNNTRVKRQRIHAESLASLLGNPPFLVQAPGLQAQVGPNQGAPFNGPAEWPRIRDDFRDGALPEFYYQPSNGEVTHRGQVIWTGDTLAQSLIVLTNRLRNM